MSYTTLARMLLIKKKMLPVYLIHSVTERCNATCGHCFVRPRATPDDLGVEEIEDICEYLGRNLYQVCLTGGEPFLRDDLPSVVAAYLGRTTARVISLSTNGYLTDRITDMVEEMVRNHPARIISVNLSIDGLGAQHDDTRKVPGLFDRVLETYCGLVKLQQASSNLAVNINVTISQSNQDHLFDLYAFLRKTLKARSITATLARGNARNPGEVQVDLRQYRRFVELLENDLRAETRRGYFSFLRGILINAQDIIARRRILKTLGEKRYLQPCYAGTLSGVIDSSGGVHACEMRPALLGDLRRQNFTQIWFGAAAEEERQRIRSCYCTHECFLLISILFNLYYLPGLMKEVALMLLGRAMNTARRRGKHG